jgi:hypothetical protein
MIPKLKIVVFNYETRINGQNRPEEIATRCKAEIFGIGNNLRNVTAEMRKSLRQKELADVARLCLYHYENLLFRMYSLRERAWDVQAALVDVPRERTGKQGFRLTVLTRTKAVYPELEIPFTRLQALIEGDMRTRNTATHETFLMLGLTNENFSNLWEVDSVLESYDPESKDGLEIRKLVRRLLRQFVTEKEKHAGEVNDVATEYCDLCDEAIRKKSW